ncbi:MAG: hypothetical protein K2M11_03485 [Paramuribaculum sp.]|nr:hypothetical protein [Paramuribaculum sp.]
MFRVENTEHTQPILSMPIAVYPNDSTYARIIAVMSEVHFNVFRVVLILDTLA